MISLNSIIASLATAQSLQNDLGGATTDDQKAIRIRIIAIIDAATADLEKMKKSVKGQDLPVNT